MLNIRHTTLTNIYAGMAVYLHNDVAVIILSFRGFYLWIQNMRPRGSAKYRTIYKR